MLQEVLEAKARQRQHPGSLPGVEHIGNENTKVTLQPPVATPHANHVLPIHHPHMLPDYNQ